MEYETDQKTEELTNPQATIPGSMSNIGKAPAKQVPSCMREHLDFLQNEVNQLEEFTNTQNKRIQYLEKLIGV